MKKIVKRISNFIENLTLKQTKVIAYSLTIFIVIYLIAFWFIYNKFMFYLSFGVAILVPQILVYIILVIEDKEFLEKEKMLRPKVRKEFDFASNKFIEIIPLPTADKKWLILSIEKNAKFFAKEIKENGEEEKIILVIKDENNKQLEKTIEVTNYYAFYNNFKLKK